MSSTKFHGKLEKYNIYLLGHDMQMFSEGNNRVTTLCHRFYREKVV